MGVVNAITSSRCKTLTQVSATRVKVPLSKDEGRNVDRDAMDDVLPVNLWKGVPMSKAPYHISDLSFSR